MNWGYRVLKKETKEGTEYGIFEVFYDENGLMKAHSKDSLTAMCDDIEDLKYELEVIGRAFELETLEYQSDEEEDTDEEEEDEYGFNDFR